MVIIILTAIGIYFSASNAPHVGLSPPVINGNNSILSGHEKEAIINIALCDDNVTVLLNNQTYTVNEVNSVLQYAQQYVVFYVGNTSSYWERLVVGVDLTNDSTRYVYTTSMYDDNVNPGAINSSIEALMIEVALHDKSVDQYLYNQKFVVNAVYTTQNTVMFDVRNNTGVWEPLVVGIDLADKKTTAITYPGMMTPISPDSTMVNMANQTNPSSPGNQPNSSNNPIVLPSSGITVINATIPSNKYVALQENQQITWLQQSGIWIPRPDPMPPMPFNYNMSTPIPGGFPYLINYSSKVLIGSYNWFNRLNVSVIYDLPYTLESGIRVNTVDEYGIVEMTYDNELIQLPPGASWTTPAYTWNETSYMTSYPAEDPNSTTPTNVTQTQYTIQHAETWTIENIGIFDK